MGVEGVEGTESPLGAAVGLGDDQDGIGEPGEGLTDRIRSQRRDQRPVRGDDPLVAPGAELASLVQLTGALRVRLRPVAERSRQRAPGVILDIDPGPIGPPPVVAGLLGVVVDPVLEDLGETGDSVWMTRPATTTTASITMLWPIFETGSTSPASGVVVNATAPASPVPAAYPESTSAPITHSTIAASTCPIPAMRMPSAPVPRPLTGAASPRPRRS